MFKLKDEIYHKTLEKDRGRIEKREYYFVKDVAWINQLSRWSELSAIGMVKAERTVNDETSTFTRFYIMSDIKSVKEFATAVRSHWGIENGLHWCLDIGFRKDESHAKKNHSAENLNIMRHMSLNMLKSETTTKQGIAGKRLKCSWDEKYLEKVIMTSFEI